MPPSRREANSRPAARLVASWKTNAVPGTSESDLPRQHVDFLRRSVTVEETIIEVSKKHFPTGERFVVKPYPKDNEPRTFGVRSDWLDALAELI